MRICTPLLALGLVACASTTTPDNQGFPVQPQEITLTYGEEKQLDESVVRLGFTDVLEDSRCAVDVVCVWQGNAAVVVTIAAGKGPAYSLTLNTALDPGSADWFGVRITLLEVAPAPLAGQPIPLESYAVRLRVAPVPTRTVTGPG